MLSPFDSNFTISPFGGDGSSLPYLAHSNLYTWDFTQRELNGSTILRVPEMARGNANAFEQVVATSQPIAVSNGANFPTDLTKSMDITAGGAVPLNNSTGVYTALNFRVDAALGSRPIIMRLYGAINTVRTERIIIRLRNFGGFPPETYIDQLDTNTFTIRQRPAMAINNATWYTLEQLHDFTPGAALPTRAWINGVEVAAGYINAFTEANYPATDSLGGIIGPTFAGTYNHIAVFDGLPPDSVRQSVSDYLNSKRPI